MHALPVPARLVVLALPLLAAACAAPLPRDLNGSPPTARLAPNAAPAAPMSDEERKKLDALNRQVLRDQEAAIARDQQARAWSRAYTYSYPYYAYPSSFSFFYGSGRHGSRWGSGISYGWPGYWGGWGGYPYWW
ncbi:hypothetical protein L602_001300001070 [Cupriavidus gilardii J11]|uniref:Lipoprotein n=1 Tax=Cupriavidus gilardii J11 TaxID=936133 RepID=A0A562BU71_9BURK|nr:hypothetical protein [Cupriavidus gilardii]TWG88350.1 hypothetical protein L602_001300001070 [Cupriavidus gilardii J11]